MPTLQIAISPNTLSAKALHVRAPQYSLKSDSLKPVTSWLLKSQIFRKQLFLIIEFSVYFQFCLRRGEIENRDSV